MYRYHPCRRRRALGRRPHQQALNRSLVLWGASLRFFDDSPLEFSSRTIGIPRSLFNGALHECRPLFAAVLLCVFKFKADEHSSIEFWKASGIHWSH